MTLLAFEIFKLSPNSEMNDLGDLNYFLGVEVIFNIDGYYLTQINLLQTCSPRPI